MKTLYSLLSPHFPILDGPYTIVLSSEVKDLLGSKKRDKTVILDNRESIACQWMINNELKHLVVYHEFYDQSSIMRSIELENPQPTTAVYQALWDAGIRVEMYRKVWDMDREQTLSHSMNVMRSRKIGRVTWVDTIKGDRIVREYTLTMMMRPPYTILPEWKYGDTKTN